MLKRIILKVYSKKSTLVITIGNASFERPMLIFDLVENIIFSNLRIFDLGPSV